MKNFIALFTICLTLVLTGRTNTAVAQAPAWQWVYSPGISSTAATAVDAAGNVYLTGAFHGTISFGATTLTAPVGRQYAYVAKLSPGGTCLWATASGGSAAANGQGLGVDAAGNVYVTGYCLGSAATFGATTLAGTPGDLDGFVARLSPAGAWEWAVGIRSAGPDDALALAVDGAGDVIVTGYYGYPLTLGAINLPSTAGPATGADYQVYVAKISPAGTWRWATSAGGRGREQGSAVAVDALDNIYVGGFFFSMAATFGATQLANTDSLTYDAFVAKLTPAGVWRWARPVAGPMNENVNAVAADGSGNVLLAGNFGSPSLTLGTTTLTNYGGIGGYVSPVDGYVARLDSVGAWQWAVQAGGEGDDSFMGVAVDHAGDAYVIGLTDSTITTVGALTLTGHHSSDILVAKLSATGQWQWATRDGGPGRDFATEIAVDPSGNVYASGNMGYVSAADTAIFGALTVPYGNTTNFTRWVDASAFVGRLSPPPLLRLVTFVPAAGAAGARVTVAGAGFSAATAVRFNGTPAASFTVVADTLLTAVVPAGATSGLISVQTATGPASTSAAFVVTSTMGQPAYAASRALTLWPNPAQDAVQLRGAAGGTVVLRDVLGRVVRAAPLRPGTTTLDLRGLPAGVYVVVAGQATRRLIVE